MTAARIEVEVRRVSNLAYYSVLKILSVAALAGLLLAQIVVNSVFGEGNMTRTPETSTLMAIVFFGALAAAIVWHLTANSKRIGPSARSLREIRGRLRRWASTLGAPPLAQRMGATFLHPRNASEAQRRDKRRPVVLLRSFADDDLGDEFFYENLFGSQTVSLEQFIAEEVKAFGPFIAVGGEAARTKDDLQVAVRDHYRGEGWRDAIVRWMDAAVFIVVIAGTTPGLEWELNTLFARKHTHKMLVVFPQANRRNRIAWVRRMLHGAPMLESSHGIEDIKGLIAISEGFDRRVLCHWGSEPPGPLEIRTALMNAICERFCAS